MRSEGFNVEAKLPHWWTKTKYERVTADRQVHRGPAFVFSLTITTDGQGAADAFAKDGFSADDPVAHDLECLSGDSKQYVFYPPKVFTRGVWIDIGSNVQSVTINYLPMQP